MNWKVERCRDSDRIQVGIQVTSEIFKLGLREILKHDAQRAIQARILTPTIAIKEIKAGTLDALILDTGSAPQLAHVLSEYKRLPRIILVSSRYHAGIRLPLPKDRICSFYSACSSEWELKHFLNIVLACHTGMDERRNCKECSIQCSLQPRSLPLSGREIEVLKLIGLLHTNSEIAATLDISVKTVEAHSNNIKHKLKLGNSRELLQKAVKWVDGF